MKVRQGGLRAPRSQVFQDGSTETADAMTRNWILATTVDEVVKNGDKNLN